MIILTALEFSVTFKLPDEFTDDVLKDSVPLDSNSHLYVTNNPIDNSYSTFKPVVISLEVGPFPNRGSA